MIRAVTDDCSPFALELCTCTRCGALLTRYDFAFDWLGRTIENCGHCGPWLLMVRRHAPVATARPVYKSKPAGKCADCPTPLTWRGTGSHPTRCPPCRKKHERAQDLKFYHSARNVTSKRQHVATKRVAAH